MDDLASRAVLIEHCARLIAAFTVTRDEARAEATRHRGRMLGGREDAEAAEALVQEMRSEIDRVRRDASEAGIEEWEIERFVRVIAVERDALAKRTALLVKHQGGK